MAQLPMTATTPRRKPQLPSPESMPTHLKRASNLPLLLTMAIITFAVVMYSEDIKTVAFEYYKTTAEYYYISDDTKSSQSPGAHPTFVQVPESCDLAIGHWVFDNVTRPLYAEKQCEYMSEQVACMQNGRKDDLFQKWRWQPRDCPLPRFDARLFLEKLRGKRMMFVGDSLNRNQWESLVCMIQPVLRKGKKRKFTQGSRSIFIAKEYNVSLEFYWAPFLVESNSDDPKIHSIDKRIIKMDKIEGHANHWKDVDYLLFNTYIWWMNTPDMRVLRSNAKNWTEYDKIERGVAYERVLRTWSNWVGKNVDPKRTSVFFMSMSPLHLQSTQWGNPDGVKCAKETEPIDDMSKVYLGTDMNLFGIAKRVSNSTLNVPVTFVDITNLSNYRKDAHTSVYTVRQGKLLTPEQQADPKTYADCIHWCTPGLPDTWNEIIYARIMSRSLNNTSS